MFQPVYNHIDCVFTHKMPALCIGPKHLLFSAAYTSLFVHAV